MGENISCQSMAPPARRPLIILRAASAKREELRLLAERGPGPAVDAAAQAYWEAVELCMAYGWSLAAVTDAVMERLEAADEAEAA
jgi:hypothetical protein